MQVILSAIPGAHFGRLKASWKSLGQSTFGLRRLRRSWKRFGNVLGDLPSVLWRLGPSWKRLGSVLGHLGTITNKQTCIENPFSPQDSSTSSCTELLPQDLVGRLGLPTSIILRSGGRVFGSEEEIDPPGGEFSVRRTIIDPPRPATIRCQLGWNIVLTSVLLRF